ncbi:hypothetical protein EVAR_80074_1 [Eumeta japonica]|uniref:Uncharacterized protein n=1 Tax=Eumeta variegata TaxID=151549 RepID=A0A4C1UCP7_EUMVA|nr:hypothetical protein EVAR_80074_1 [Eumeta japonica]
MDVRTRPGEKMPEEFTSLTTGDTLKKRVLQFIAVLCSDVRGRVRARRWCAFLLRAPFPGAAGRNYRRRPDVRPGPDGRAQHTAAGRRLTALLGSKSGDMPLRNFYLIPFQGRPRFPPRDGSRPRLRPRGRRMNFYTFYIGRWRCVHRDPDLVSVLVSVFKGAVMRNYERRVYVMMYGRINVKGKSSHIPQSNLSTLSGVGRVDERALILMR